MITNAVARRRVNPIPALRPPSPAELDVMPKEAVPGSPITNAVASQQVKPNEQLRPPSPAIRAVMPSDGVPGSLTPRVETENECGRHEQSQLAGATAEPGQPRLDTQSSYAGLTFSTTGDSND
jgi:hypothetical protein